MIEARNKIISACLQLENENGRTKGLMAVHGIILRHLQDAPFRATGLIVSILTKGSGPKTRACLKAPEIPPNRVRESPQILAPSSFLYFIEVKPILTFHFQKRFLDPISLMKEASPLASHSSGPWQSLRNSQSPQLLSGAGYVRACVQVAGKCGDTVTISKSQTTGLLPR